MNSDFTKEKVREQIENNMNNLPKTMGRAIRKLKSEKGYTDNDILLHLGKMFRYSITFVVFNLTIVTLYKLYVYTHAYFFADRSLESIKSHMSTDLFIYLIFMIPAVIYVINAFSIYKARIVYKHVLDLHEIIEEGEKK